MQCCLCLITDVLFPITPLGTTYRTREEVGAVRQARDPIEYVKKLLVDEKLATADELKQIEKEIRNEVILLSQFVNKIICRILY